MIPLENKPNVVPPDIINLYGQLKDDDGTGNGTPVTKNVYQDFHTFFGRLMAASGIVPNGVLDDAFNGWQLFNAFMAHISPVVWQNIPLNTSGGASYVAGARTPQYAVLGSGQVLLRGVLGTSSSPPAGDHAISSASLGIPDQRRDFLTMKSNLGEATAFYVHTDGVLRANSSIFSWGGTAILDGLSFWIAP